MKALALAGLKAPASISIDTWGMPHIRAETAEDAFFVQGFNAARDRLWQIDLWRKRGLGLLAADFGPGYLMQDRAARLFLYRGDMAAEWAAYGDDGEMICAAFAAGINAGIDQIDAGALPLPPEFAELGTRPARWRPEDVVRIRTHCLSRNAASELARARVQRLADPEVDLLRWPLSPPVPGGEWENTSPVELPDDAKIPRVPHPEDEPEGHADEKAPPKGLMIGANNRWEIPRVLADRWESHPHRLGSAVEHGEGWKMTRVKNGSPGWWLGMRRGDIILTVNDMKLNTKPQLIAAYLKLKNKTEFEVKIDRDGTIRKHKYTIVD